MEKIHIGDKVAYKNPNSVLGKLMPSGTAENVIPNGMPIGNGEINVSGQDIIVCKPDECKTMLIFRRDELVKIKNS